MVSVLRRALPKDVFLIIEIATHIVLLLTAITVFKLFLDGLCSFLWRTYPDTLYSYFSLDKCGHPIVPKSK